MRGKGPGSQLLGNGPSGCLPMLLRAVPEEVDYAIRSHSCDRSGGLCCSGIGAASNPSPARASVQNVSLAAGQSAVTGCLKGSTNQFYLMEQNGTLHLLMGPNKELQAHVGYWVELGGNRDSSRDASASSDEGTAHGMRFFQVEEVLARISHVQ